MIERLTTIRVNNQFLEEKRSERVEGNKIDCSKAGSRQEQPSDGVSSECHFPEQEPTRMKIKFDFLLLKTFETISAFATSDSCKITKAVSFSIFERCGR